MEHWGTWRIGILGVPDLVRILSNLHELLYEMIAGGASCEKEKEPYTTALARSCPRQQVWPIFSH